MKRAILNVLSYIGLFAVMIGCTLIGFCDPEIGKPEDNDDYWPWVN